jgi:histidinol phosphatase-like enzyme
MKDNPVKSNSTVLINKDSAVIQKTGNGYIDFELLPTVSAGIRLFNEHNFNVIMLDGEQRYNSQEETEWIFPGEKSLELTLGDARINGIYHYNDTAASGCRSLLEQTLFDNGINTADLYFIGDSFKDMKIAHSIGCNAVIVPSKLPELELLSNRKFYSEHIDFVSRDFVSASRWILANTLPMSDVSIIIPTRNEEHNLPLILPYLPRSAEIVVVDGHSEDNTVKIARGLRPDAVILHQKGRGKGNALKMGFHHATREFIITFDADGSFRPSEVYKLIQKLREGYDLVKGSRFMPEVERWTCR